MIGRLARLPGPRRTGSRSRYRWCRLRRRKVGRAFGVLRQSRRAKKERPSSELSGAPRGLSTSYRGRKRWRNGSWSTPPPARAGRVSSLACSKIGTRTRNRPLAAAPVARQTGRVAQCPLTLRSLNALVSIMVLIAGHFAPLKRLLFLVIMAGRPHLRLARLL